MIAAITSTTTAAVATSIKDASATSPVREDYDLLSVLRYIERNPVRAGLVEKAQDWLWPSAAVSRFDSPSLDVGPVLRASNWLQQVNTAQTEAEVAALRECIRRRRPYGEAAWGKQSAAKLGLEAGLRPQGGPRKRTNIQPSQFYELTEQE